MIIHATESGVFNAKKGDYNGGTYLFTHRDPKTGNMFGEDIPVPGTKPVEYGMWVNPDSVVFKEAEPKWNELVM